MNSRESNNKHNDLNNQKYKEELLSNSDDDDFKVLGIKTKRNKNSSKKKNKNKEDSSSDSGYEEREISNKLNKSNNILFKYEKNSNFFDIKNELKDINNYANIKTDFKNLIINNIKSDDEVNLGNKNKIKNILNTIPKINESDSFDLKQKNLMINNIDKNIKNYKSFEIIGKIQITPININDLQKLKKMKMKSKQKYIMMENIQENLKMI